MTNIPSEPALDVRAVAASIAEQLGETTFQPIVQIRRIVHHLGAEVALAVLEEVTQVETAGGMMLADGSRRRTPGGVYFSIIRGRVTDEQGAAIFPNFLYQKRRAAERGSKAKTSPTPAPTLLDPADLPNLNGDATVKITLIGRPGPTKVMRDGYVMTAMRDTKAPTLPKGLPVPPSAATTYTVYIAPKQWRKVAEALRNPDDALIVEGWPTYDPELEGIAIYVTNATTKMLQREKRAQE